MELIKLLSHYIEVQHALIFILSGFFVGIVWIFIKWYYVQTELSGLTKEVRSILSGAKLIDFENFEKLADRMKRSKLVSHAWNEFDETIIRDDSEERVQIYNVKSISEFMPKEAFLEENLSVSFFRKIPNLITSLGLFFTFLFIIFGLAHLVPQSSGKIDGVPELIRGLSAKFESSVLAILCAMAFTLVEDRLIRSVELAYKSFIDLLDSKFQRKTAEDYLRSLDKNMRELNHSMKRFSTDLAGVIKEGLQEGMRPSTDRLLVAIENLEKQKSENIADTLNKLLGDFKASLNQSTGNEFAALGTSVSKLAQIMNDSAERSELMSSKISGLVTAIDSQLQKQEQNSDASVQKLQQGFTHLLTSIEATTQAQNENLNRLLADVVAKTTQATSGLISNVESLSERNTTMMGGFNNLNENLVKSVEGYQEAVKSTKSLISSTSDLANNLGSTLNQLASVQTRIDQTFQLFLQESTVVQGIQKENAEAVKRYQDVFSEVERGLGVVLAQLGENLQRYNDLTRTGLEGYLTQYDQSLSSATTKLSSTVKDLDEVLENFGDHMEVIRKAVGA